MRRFFGKGCEQGHKQEKNGVGKYYSLMTTEMLVFRHNDVNLYRKK